MKKFRSVIALLLAMCMIIGMCACGSDKGNSNESNNDNVVEDNGNENDTNAEPDATPEDDKVEEPADEGTKYSIIVVDQEQNPIAGAMVQICKDSCMWSTTDENGVAEFAVEESEGYKASLLAAPEGYESAMEEAEIYFEDGSFEVTIIVKATE